MNSTHIHRHDFSAGIEVSWEDGGRGSGRTSTALCLSPASCFASILALALKELRISNCNTHNQFYSSKPTTNCRGNLATSGCQTCHRIKAEQINQARPLGSQANGLCELVFSLGDNLPGTFF